MTHLERRADVRTAVAPAKAFRRVFEALAALVPDEGRQEAPW